MEYRVISRKDTASSTVTGQTIYTKKEEIHYVFEADNVEQADKSSGSYFTIRFKRGKVTAAIFPSGHWTAVVPAEGKIIVNGEET